MFYNVQVKQDNEMCVKQHMAVVHSDLNLQLEVFCLIVYKKNAHHISCNTIVKNVFITAYMSLGSEK